jgi:phospholipid/cholesterol/gamma-HCH transport system substrate-binding protein
MRPRRGGIGGVASSPVLVGAVTVVVVFVAVFLAYNANNGLPFVPTYDVHIQVPNANALVKGNEARVGGVRVGLIKSVTPVRLPNGRFAADVSVSLDENVNPLPTDTTVAIRNKSSIGLKYLEIDPGNSPNGYKADATIPVTSYSPQTVELDEFFNMFNTPTRRAIKISLTGFGNTFAGRGPDLNGAFEELRPLLVHLQPALANLLAPQTNFAGFWRSLESIAAEVAPVAESQAQLFVGLDRTFTAFAHVARPFIQETIDKSAPTEDTAIHTLPALRPFFNHFQQFFAAFQPGAEALANTSPEIARALKDGIPVLNASPVLYAQLEPTAQALLDFQSSPGVIPGLELLTSTNQILDPGLRFITPAQATCNYLTLLFGNAASIGNQGNDLGTWTRVLPIDAPNGAVKPEGQNLGANNEGTPSSAPASGPGANYLHTNPYPYTASPGQPASCMAGNEQYVGGVTSIGNPSGRITLNTRGQKPFQLNQGGK